MYCSQPVKRGAGTVLASVLCICLAAVVSCGSAGWGQAAEGAVNHAAEQARRAGDLLAGLQQGETVRLVVFGDSLTAGWGTDGHQVYHRWVTDVLRFAFPESALEVVVHGHPGETTEGALRRFEVEVAAAEPDLLLVQFGGNDKGWGRPLESFRRDLGTLLQRACTETEALIIACLPPIVDPDPENPWNAAARAVAAEHGVYAADLDRAIRQGDADFRGPFPHGSHPDSFTHAIMGREVLRAMREAVGVGEGPVCRLLGGTRLEALDGYDIAIEMHNPADTPVECEWQLEWLEVQTGDSVRLAEGETVHHTLRVALPAFNGLSQALPVRLLSRGGGFGDLHVRWLTVAPAIRADSTARGQEGVETLTWHEITAASFVIGRHRWLGPQDLSGRFATVLMPDRIRLVIDVTDDDITTASLDDPSKGDSAELYLDLRPDEDQGKPVYGPEVIALQIIPPTPDGEPARWQSMQPLPEMLSALAVECSLTEKGYRVQADLPLEAVITLRGEDWQGFGFDIGINDADAGGTRKSQLMWTGYPDNYLNPAYLAGLYVDEIPPDATRRTLR